MHTFLVLLKEGRAGRREEQGGEGMHELRLQTVKRDIMETTENWV